MWEFYIQSITLMIKYNSDINDYHSVSYSFDNYYTKFIGKVLNYKKTTEIQCIKVNFGLDVS